MRKIAFVIGSKTKKTKSPRQLERHIKGMANHRRIEIILWLSQLGPMNLDQLVAHLRCHQTTVSEHTSKLVRAGLIKKIYEGKYVMHSLSPYGKEAVRFIKSFGSN